jgi:hypothetical protein
MIIVPRTRLLLQPLELNKMNNRQSKQVDEKDISNFTLKRAKQAGNAMLQKRSISFGVRFRNEKLGHHKLDLCVHFNSHVSTGNIN